MTNKPKDLSDLFNNYQAFYSDNNWQIYTPTVVRTNLINELR